MSPHGAAAGVPGRWGRKGSLGCFATRRAARGGCATRAALTLRAATDVRHSCAVAVSCCMGPAGVTGELPRVVSLGLLPAVAHVFVTAATAHFCTAAVYQHGTYQLWYKVPLEHPGVSHVEKGEHWRSYI